MTTTSYREKLCAVCCFRIGGLHVACVPSRGLQPGAAIPPQCPWTQWLCTFGDQATYIILSKRGSQQACFQNHQGGEAEVWKVLHQKLNAVTRKWPVLFPLTSLWPGSHMTSLKHKGTRKFCLIKMRRTRSSWAQNTNKGSLCCPTGYQYLDHSSSHTKYTHPISQGQKSSNFTQL